MGQHVRQNPPNQVRRCLLEKTVKLRDAVHGRPAGVFSGEYRGFLDHQMVDVPEPLVDLYKQKPEAVLNELLSIMEAGSPRDASSAAAYGFELLRGPGAGVICVRVFDGKIFDTVDKNWNTTSRAHWIEHLRDAMTKRASKGGQ